MSIFGDILHKIFHAAVPSANAEPAPATAPDAAVAAAAASVPAQPVDVAAVLDGMLASSGQNLNWRQSIVDLMKLLGLDSSLANRQNLADELGFEGNKSDSASMNIWLHKQVMQKLAENGGKVPDDLKT